MCEIFATSAAKPVEVDDYLREFFSDSVWNPHGWGLAWHEEGADDAPGRIELFKEPVTAVESGFLEYLLGMGVRSRLIIGHIRNATRGIVSYSNCHPFVARDDSGRQWVFCHNGTIMEDELIRPYESVQEGATDSERVLLLFIDRINAAIRRKGSDLTFDERFDVLSRAMDDLAGGNKLNVVFDDGEYLYAHTNTIQTTLHMMVQDGVAYFCSRPLGGGWWQPVPRCVLTAYRDGGFVRAARGHGKDFDNDLYLRIIHGQVA